MRPVFRERDRDLARDSLFWSPLHWAAWRGAPPRELRALLQLPPDPSSHRPGIPALLLAARAGAWTSFRTLLEDARASEPSLDRESRGVLHHAVQGGARDFVFRWLREFPGCPVEPEDSEFITPLTLACGQGDLEIVKALVAHGANVNHHFCSGSCEPSSILLDPAPCCRSPLAFALFFGQLRITHYLISQKAELRGCDLAHWSVRSDSPELLQLLLREPGLLDRSRFAEPLASAAVRDRAECAELLLRNSSVTPLLRLDWELEPAPTILHPITLAAGSGSFNTLRMMLRLRPELLESRGERGESLLQLCAGARTPTLLVTQAGRSFLEEALQRTELFWPLWLSFSASSPNLNQLSELRVMVLDTVDPVVFRFLHATGCFQSSGSPQSTTTGSQSSFSESFGSISSTSAFSSSMSSTSVFSLGHEEHSE